MSTQPKLLMEGTFESFSIDEVLDVVGLSRQTMEVVLEDESRRGNIVVKAGQVLSANAPPDHGRGAFHALIGGLLPLLLTAVLRQRLTGAEARHEEQGQQQGRERTPKGGATHDFSFREPLPDAPRVISPLNRINRNPRPMRM